jgi:hypothetical protein
LALAPELGLRLVIVNHGPEQVERHEYTTTSRLGVLAGDLARDLREVPARHDVRVAAGRGQHGVRVAVLATENPRRSNPRR